MSDFTRGNWVILPPDDIENSYLIEAQSDDGIIENSTLICECYSEVNARLIAAAPEMYELLQSLISVLAVHSYSESEAVKIYKLLARIDGKEELL